MAYEPQEGRGIFSPNHKKTNPSAPDWKGNIMIDGKVVRFSGWKRSSQYGEFLSLAVDKPFNEQPQYPRQEAPKNPAIDFESDVPW